VSDSDEPTVINNAKTFLNNLGANIQAYDLEQQIASQEDALKKAEKKYKNLLNDADDLQKKKRNIEKDIADNQKDQQNQQSEVEKQKQLTETLKAKRITVK
jgi:predicted  nucleic acid-binding Zn-ribbon protein